MISSTRTAPPNSMVTVSDPVGGDPPSTLPASRIAATPSCIVIGCLAFMDGPTSFVLGQAVEVDPGYPAVLDVLLETPSRTVSVKTVEGETLLKEPIGTARTRVLVWVNREREPDEVRIGLG